MLWLSEQYCAIELEIKVEMIFPPAVTQHLAVNMANDLQKLKKTLQKINVETATASVEADEVITTLIRSEPGADKCIRELSKKKSKPDPRSVK